MLFPELETSRLKLVQIKHEHIPYLYTILSREDVTRYYGMDAITTIDEAEQIYESFRQNFLHRRGIRWGIIWKETGVFIGTVGYHNQSSWNKRAEIGYELHPEFWRRGIAKEAVIRVIDYAFLEMELVRISAITFPANDPSNKLLKSLGFIEEGIVRSYLYQNGSHHDGLLYSLLKNEWHNM